MFAGERYLAKHLNISLKLRPQVTKKKKKTSWKKQQQQQIQISYRMDAVEVFDKYLCAASHEYQRE